jgi:polyphosphate kinase 2 (PPK2 family)
MEKFIRRLMLNFISGIYPEVYQVFCFKMTSAEEQAHNYLRLYSNKLPEYGKIGIFNPAGYLEICVVILNP